MIFGDASKRLSVQSASIHRQGFGNRSLALSYGRRLRGSTRVGFGRLVGDFRCSLDFRGKA